VQPRVLMTFPGTIAHWDCTPLHGCIRMWVGPYPPMSGRRWEAVWRASGFTPTKGGPPPIFFFFSLGWGKERSRCCSCCAPDDVFLSDVPNQSERMNGSEHRADSRRRRRRCGLSCAARNYGLHSIIDLGPVLTAIFYSTDIRLKIENGS